MSVYIYKRKIPNSEYASDYITHPEIIINSVNDSVINFTFNLHTLSLGYEQAIRTADKEYIIKKPIEYINIRRAAHKTEPFIISTMCETDYTNNELLLNEYTASKMSIDERIAVIIYKSTNNDIFIYVKCYSTVSTTVGEVIETYADPEDIINELFGEADYVKFVKERYKDKYINNQFFTKMCSFATPVGSYLDLEADFLMSFAKYLYDNSDEKFMNFIQNNEKYKLILEKSIASGSNTIENKEIGSIERSFNRKKIIQDQISEYKNMLKSVDEAASLDDLKASKILNNVEE